MVDLGESREGRLGWKVGIGGRELGAVLIQGPVG